MKRPMTALLAVLLIAAGAFIWIQHQSQEKLRADINSLTDDNNQLKAGTENLSNLLAQANSSQGASQEQLSELLKLRGEVGMLRGQTGQLARLRTENQRLQTTLSQPKPEPATADAAEQQRQITIQKLNTSRQGILAFIMFAADNQDQYPTNFAQAARYTKGDFMDQVQTNFDLVYQGPASSIANPANTIVLREKQATQQPDGRWVKVYGFADGHSEGHVEPDGKFDDWENQRIIQPPPQN
ncbi:MAG: hypothetical protein JF609_02725 [Verrucomicrobia bacterium]|nr:hypothetical protein [Verrucomicrobiota bacterium]